MSFPIQLDRPLIVFDVETTGLAPRKDRIIELAACRVNADGTEESKCWLLNPTVPIPAETSAIHGITDEIVKDCPTFAEKADEIYAFFEGADLSGFNSDRFDILCLEEEFARCNRSFGTATRRRVDVQRIYHRMEPRDLSAAVKRYLGHSHDGAHGAEADARATLEVLKAQLREYSDKLPKTVGELDELLVPRDPLNADRNGMIRWKDGEWTINFGKKKGMSLRRMILDVNERGFFKWILNGNFEADVRMIAIEALKGRLPPPPSGVSA